MASLRYLLHSACHLIGIPIDYDHHRDHDHVESLKVGINGGGCGNHHEKNQRSCSSPASVSSTGSAGFEMPLHYPHYKKVDYENMEEWKLDLLLKQYGLSFHGNLDQKKAYAIVSFLWPDQY